MKAVLEMVKRFVFEIACIAGAIIGIVMIYFGYSGMSDIKTDMQTALGVRNKLKTMASANKNLINDDAVKLAKKRIDQIMEGDKKVMAKVREINYYPPLTDTAFPASTPGQRSDFKDAYQREVQSWLGKLNAGDVPTADDIAQMRDRIEEERNSRRDLGLDTETEGDQLVNRPEVRAALSKANSIYCYATEDSFHQSDVSDRDPSAPMYVDRPPSPEQMWHAQLEVWMQRLIVDGIASVNQAAAKRLRENNEEPWVGNLPIKELVSIQTTEYYVTKTSTAPVAKVKDRPVPPGSPAAVFTGNASNELYELAQLTVVLIVDATDIPGVLSDLCRDRFLTPLRVEYEVVEPNASMTGKIYGNDPVVRLTVDFETQFISEFYLPLMPDEILEQLKKKRPEPPKTDGA